MKLSCEYKGCNYEVDDPLDGAIFALEFLKFINVLTVVPVYTNKIYLCPKHKETLENLIRGHLKEDICDTD